MFVVWNRVIVIRTVAKRKVPKDRIARPRSFLKCVSEMKARPEIARGKLFPGQS